MTNESARALAALRWSRLRGAERRAAIAPMVAASAAARRKYPRCKRYGSHRFSPKGRCPCGFRRP